MPTCLGITVGSFARDARQRLFIDIIAESGFFRHRRRSFDNRDPLCRNVPLRTDRQG